MWEKWVQSYPLGFFTHLPSEDPCSILISLIIPPAVFTPLFPLHCLKCSKTQTHLLDCTMTWPLLLPAKGIFFPLLLNALSFLGLAWHVSPILGRCEAGAGTMALHETLGRPAPSAAEPREVSVQRWYSLIDRTGKRTCVLISLSFIFNLCWLA